MAYEMQDPSSLPVSIGQPRPTMYWTDDIMDSSFQYLFHLVVSCLKKMMMLLEQSGGLIYQIEQGYGKLT